MPILEFILMFYKNNTTGCVIDIYICNYIIYKLHIYIYAYGYMLIYIIVCNDYIKPIYINIFYKYMRSDN